MKLIEALLYEAKAPKALIMGGGAGSGKTSFVGKVTGEEGYTAIAEKLQEKGWEYFNPDKYARDPEHAMYKNLSAASVANRKEVESAIEGSQPNLVWDTTANNVAETLKVPQAGYDTMMFMMYTHPMVSIFNNFARASKEGEESLPISTVVSTWVSAYKADTVESYKKALGDRFFLVDNPGGKKKQANYGKLIGEFTKQLAKGPQGLLDYFEKLQEDPFFRTSMSKPAPTLPSELQADYDQKVKELGLQLTPDEDKKLKRKVLDRYNKEGDFIPAKKTGRLGGYEDNLRSIRDTEERVAANNKKAVEELYAIMKNQDKNMISKDEAIAKAKAFLG